MINQQAPTMAVGDIIEVNDKMQSAYRYELVAPVGEKFFKEFSPFYSPRRMLEMGVFEGKYCNDCTNEFPEAWYRNAKTSQTPDPTLNYFGVKSRQPLSVWQKNGWIYGPDPRGWFQWYCSAGACPKSTASKSSAGRHLPGMPVKSAPTATPAIFTAAPDNGRRFSSGHMIR